VSARGVGDADVNRGKLCISLSITGQCNAMGTREWSSCSGLPAYRSLEKEQDRREIAEYWGIDADFFPDKRGLFMLGLGVAAWFRFIHRSVRDDYTRFVAGVLFEPGELRRIL